MKIKLSDYAQWQDCRLYHMGHGQNHYLKFATDDRAVTVYGTRELGRKLRRLADLIDPPGQEPDPPPDMPATPADVVHYFSGSDVLKPHLADVQAVLGSLQRCDLDQVERTLDTSALFEDGQPIRGAQAEIARALEIPNAGGYRKRILAVLEQLQQKHSTTTLQKPENGENAA